MTIRKTFLAVALVALSAPVFASPVLAQAQRPASPVVNEYRLGPRDKVKVTVFGETDLSGEFVVSGTGQLAFPLIGELKAQGLTSSQLQEAIRARLADGLLRDPRVTVDLLTLRPFYILGEVNKPGEYAYSDGLTLQNAVAMAGGYTYRADSRKVFVKHLDQTEQSVSVQGAPTVAIQPGDTIRIPERFF